MDENCFCDKETDKKAFSEEELKSDIENVLKKYIKSAAWVSIAVAASVAIITCI